MSSGSAQVRAVQAAVQEHAFHFDPGPTDPKARVGMERNKQEGSYCRQRR